MYGQLIRTLLNWSKVPPTACPASRVTPTTTPDNKTAQQQFWAATASNITYLLLLPSSWRRCFATANALPSGSGREWRGLIQRPWFTSSLRDSTRAVEGIERMEEQEEMGEEERVLMVGGYVIRGLFRPAMPLFLVTWDPSQLDLGPALDVVTTILWVIAFFTISSPLTYSHNVSSSCILPFSPSSTSINMYMYNHVYKLTIA